MNAYNWEPYIRAHENPYTIGTRLAFHVGPEDYRVVCATCHEGGIVRHNTKLAAHRAAARDSGRGCKCGAS